MRPSAIAGFNNLPIKIVLVHNGILKTNIRPTFDGFINREFKEGEFERWDIYYLTDLFSEYLFSEYLLADAESNRLFKKTLAILDMPDYDYLDFKLLVNLQFEKAKIAQGRVLNKLFATLNILISIIFHYSKENNNLVAAKECSKYIILNTWSWILRMKFENKSIIISAYKKLLSIQYDILNIYFKKTFNVAKIPNGLFADNVGFFEFFGFPMRCFSYLEDVVYYCRLRAVLPSFNLKSNKYKLLKNKQKDLIMELIENNSGFFRPIIDSHSIAIVQLFLFFADKECLRKKDVNFLASYAFEIFNIILLTKRKHNRFPEYYDNIDLVIEAFATNKKPKEYCDSSSILIAILLELLVIFDSKESYDEVYAYLPKDLSLQIPSIKADDYDVEQLLFEKHLDNEYYLDCIDPLVSNFDDFKKIVKNKKSPKAEYRTDNANFSFLRYLAHSYFKNEILPEEWRYYIN